MSTLAPTSERLRACFVAAAVAAALLCGGAPAQAADTDRVEHEYETLLNAERAQRSRESVTERLVSGAAALVIGLYGYYQDDRGLLTRLVYSATQTAGVILLSDAILDANRPSILLLSDRYLNRRGEMDLRRWKRAIVLVERKRIRGERKQLAYTSAILASIYGYNGYRESRLDRPQGSLRDAFFFLSANFTLISGVSFYRLFVGGDPLDQSSDSQEASLELRPLPYPTLTYRF